jgi:hypothetical protein
MGIDRIGKGSGGFPIGDVQPSGAGGVGSKPPTDFKVAGIDSVDAPAESSLDQLRAGKISVSEYLDSQVQLATAHLDGRLSTEQLSFVRDSLREQLSADPMLVDLVKSATGALPPARE